MQRKQSLVMRIYDNHKSARLLVFLPIFALIFLTYQFINPALPTPAKATPPVGSPQITISSTHSGSTVNIPLTPTPTGTIASATSTVTVTTNVVTGYDLSITTDTTSGNTTAALVGGG